MLFPRPTDRRHAIGRLACLLIVALVGSTLAAAYLLFPSGLVHGQAQDVLHVDVVKAGESTPVLLYADNIATWQEGTEQAIVLRGKVWIEQGLVSLRIDQGVIWVDTKTTGPNARTYTLELYGEGSKAIPATLEEGTGRRTAAKIRLRLATTGDVTMKSFVGNIEKTNLAADTLFQRAVQSRAEDGGRRAEEKTGRVVPIPEGIPASDPKTPFVRTAEFQDVPPLTDPKFDPTEPQPVANPVPPLGSPPPLTPSGQPGIPFVIVPAPGYVPPLTVNSPGMSGMPPSAMSPFSTPAPLPTPMPSPTPSPKDAPGKASGPAPERIINVRPGTSQPFNPVKQLLPNGELATIINSRVIITVQDPLTRKVLIDMEADRVVIWNKGDRAGDSLSGVREPQGQATKSMEFYLAGNVQIRNQQAPGEAQILRAQEVYYDVSRNVAVAIKADVEFQSPKILFPAHFKAEEMLQTGPKTFEGRKSSFSDSALPSDPSLMYVMTKATLEETDTPMKTIFGLPYYNLKTGEEVTTPQRILTAEDATVQLEGLPIFYFPFLKTDANRPLGPLELLGVNYSTIFGMQFMSTWNVFDLIGIVPDAGKKWDLFVDEMTLRGPSLGTTYHDAGKDFLGLGGSYETMIKLFGMTDHGTDILGGNRGIAAYTGPYTFLPITPPELRGRALVQLNVFDLPDGFTFQGQYSQISDRNYLEQYMSPEWFTGLNQETFAYLKEQEGIWAWSILAEERIRPWITETNWLPKLDGWLIGYNPLECLTLDSHVSGGYAQLNPTTSPSYAYQTTDQQVGTARLDAWNQFSTVFALGDLKVMPYAILDLTYYSQDLAGNEIGRIYGGGGLRTSLPFSRLFPEIQSELFNLNGIYHKIVFSGNYFYAQTNVHYNQLPQLDQLYDNATDQAMRDIFTQQSVLNPANATFLTTSKLFDPQFYAIRTLVQNQIDTMDDIDVLQLDVRQRWQTKRGFPGDESVVDWMTLDLSASVFPQSTRDNFGHPIGLMQYDWLWNIGDRTSLFSSGWLEPESGGPRFFDFGTTISRPDRSSFTLSYRQIDPLNSKAVIGAVTYPLSAKYAITASVMYDFGVNTQINTIMLTRIGTDLRFSFGFSYNSILNNFGVMMEVVPNMMPNAGRALPGLPPAG